MEMINEQGCLMFVVVASQSLNECQDFIHVQLIVELEKHGHSAGHGNDELCVGRSLQESD